MRKPPALIAITAAMLVASTVAAHGDRAVDAAFADLRHALATVESQLPRITDAADAAAEAIVDGAGRVVTDPPLANELGQGPGAMLFDERARNVVLSLEADRLIVTVVDRRYALRTAGLPVVTAWAFECELFAACVRRGRVPVVRQSFEIDTRRQRYWRYEGQRFHHDRWISPQQADVGRSVLGRRYLDGVGAVLRDLETAGRDAIDEAVGRARDARAAGGVVYLVTGGPYLPHRLASQDIAGLTPLGDQTPGLKDFVIAVGVDAPVGGEWWGDVDRMREAGFGVAWIANACNTFPHDLRWGDLPIDLWTPFGDGLVRVEHYDARLGPANTFAADAVTRVIRAGLQ